MSKNTPPDCFLSFAEVAAIIGLAEKSIRHGEAGTDELLRIKLGKRVVFSFNDVQAWIERRKAQAREQREREAAAGDNVAQKLAERLRRKQFVKDMVKRMTR
jgi:predicted DNA-binding transcriptional regulator AlpA